MTKTAAATNDEVRFDENSNDDDENGDTNDVDDRNVVDLESRAGTINTLLYENSAIFVVETF